MKSSIAIAVLIAFVASGWILSGQFGDESRSSNGKATAAQADALGNAKSTSAKELMRVRVRQSSAQPMVNEIVVRGRTEASRQATLSAETPGRIVSVDAKEGTHVKLGQAIVPIAIDDRTAILDEAAAQLAQRQLEHEAASKLQQKGFQSRTRLAEATARLNAATAYLAKIKIDINRTLIQAPFDGVLQHRAVELGDYVAPGDPVATIMDLDPILIIGYLSERDVSKIRVGEPGYARVVNGDEFAGTIRYISSAAGEETRTFAIELEVANADYAILQGLTAGLRLPLAQIEAHLLSPAALTLADNGTVGVKIVDELARVRFVPVAIFGDSPEGIWVGGLPATVTLITVGHEFVQTGIQVMPVPELANES